MKETETAMTDEQKKTYYVTKIARLSSEEYKYIAGEFASVGVTILNFFAQGLIPNFPITPAMAATAAVITIYCGIAHHINKTQQEEAAEELKKLNETNGRSR